MHYMHDKIYAPVGFKHGGVSMMAWLPVLQDKVKTLELELDEEKSSVELLNERVTRSRDQVGSQALPSLRQGRSLWPVSCVSCAQPFTLRWSSCGRS